MDRTRKKRVCGLLISHTKDQYLLHNRNMKGLTAAEAAKMLGISRANASQELNSLVKDGRAIKIKRKPVLFFSKTVIEECFSIKIIGNQFGSFQEIFDATPNNSGFISDTFQLIGKNASLKKQIEAAKGAVLYPPRGLNTLITGETGVGKSLFAEEMYQFGLKNNIWKKNSPFVVFNCADYVENKQLLLSQLFGYVKGAFTGASEDHEGLVEQAEGGILFLDEIHRLPEEGQEMLFLLMDKGIYRKLGETSFTRKADLMIVGATTESLDTSMLTTFLRRMPIIIQLPSLKERTVEERLELIFHLFNQESQRINKKILVMKEVFCALLLYECKANIGQLKSDIQVICSRAFLESVTKQLEVVKVGLHHLPKYIYDSLSLKKENHNVTQLLGYMSSETICFPENYSMESEKLSLKEYKTNFELTNKISYLWSEMNDLKNEQEKTVQEQLIDQRIYLIVRQVLSQYLEWNKKENVEQYYSIISLHLQHILANQKSEIDSDAKEDDSFYDSHGQEYMIAQEILNRLSSMFQIDFNFLDIQSLSRFLSITKNHQNSGIIPLLVIMHGEATASSMVSFANELLQVNHIYAIDMKLSDTVDCILEVAIDKCQQIDQGKGVLILADMGSILGFGKYISQILNTKVEVIDLISTPLLLEAARKSLNSETDLKHLVEELLAIRKDYYIEIERDAHIYDTRYFDSLLIENMKGILTFLDAEKAYRILKEIVERILMRLNVQDSDDFLVKFIFHTSSMIERCIVKDYLSYNGWKERFFQYPLVSLVIKEEFSLVQEVFGIKIPDEEFATILDMFVLQYSLKESKQFG